MNLDLNGKRALVCGATQGIGKASAMELAKLGASVTLLARNEDSLKATLTELPQHGQIHHYLVADFNDSVDLKKKIENYLEKETVNILLNNTGGPPGGPITEARVDEFLSAFNNHLVCNHILTQACIQGMKKSGYGRIINIISTSVKQPLKGLGVSNTIRAAVGNWSKTMSLELAPFSITVNNVLPGATNTQRISGLLKSKAQSSGKSEKELEQEMMDEIPMRRFADPSETAAAVAFLASPAAAYITGVNLPVDGGRTGCL